MSPALQLRLLTVLIVVLGFVLVLTGHMDTDVWVGLTAGAALPSPLEPARPR